MHEILFDLVNKFGGVKAITGCSEFPIDRANKGQRFEQFEFMFEHCDVVIGAVEIDDTIDISVGESSLPFKVKMNSAPWDEVIGRPLLFAWLLTNQSNFKDGFQFECKGQNGFINIQFIIEGSSISVRHFQSL